MKESTVEIPNEFMCPISCAIMSNPVLAEDGETYEREVIEEYFASKLAHVQSAQDNTKAVQKKGVAGQPAKITSPLHATEMGTKLTPNLGIFRQIKRFLENNPSVAKEAYFEEGLIVEALKAIQLGSVDSLRRLIEKDRRLLEKEIKEGKSLVEVVCQEGTPELLSAVLTALRKSNTNTPLFSDTKSKTLLLLCVKSMQKNGFNAFIKGCEWTTQQTEEFYKTQIKEGCNDLVKAFVQYEIMDIDKPLDDQKNTALHLAVFSNQPELIKLLIELGANTKIPNQEGLDVKQLAKKINDHKLVRDISQWRHDKKSAPLREEVQKLEGKNAKLKGALALLQRENTELKGAFELLRKDVTQFQREWSPKTERKVSTLLIEHRQREERLLVERQAAERQEAEREAAKREAARIASLPPSHRVNAKAQHVSGHVRKEAITELLDFTVRGQLEEVRGCLRRNRDLVHAQEDVTDLSKRFFPQITGFQYAVWSGDEELWNIFLEFLPEKEAYDQLMALINERPDIIKEHGAPLSFFDPLLKAYQRYIDNYEAWSGYECGECWNERLGKAQRNMPAWFIYVFSEEGEDKAWPTKRMTRRFTRNLEHIKMWFEQVHGYGWLGSTFAFRREVAWAPKATRGGADPGAPGHWKCSYTIEAAHDALNSATLKTECTKKLAVLTERLSQPSKSVASISSPFGVRK